jgi:hypothetical protein
MVNSLLFLDAFAKQGEATINFIMPVRPSVRPHGTFKSPLKGFSLFDI